MMALVGELAPAPPELDPARNDLLSFTGGRTVVWVGRGATALYYAFLAARAMRGESRPCEVIVPSIACPSLAHTARMAGLMPRFADVDADTGLITLDAAKARRTANTVAVVAVHLYGNTLGLDELADWARVNGMLLIEDNAHALGARLPNGLPVGSVGDFSFYSFGPAKIITPGGGALLARSQAASEAAVEALRRRPLSPAPAPEASRLLAQNYRNLQVALITLYRQGRLQDPSAVHLPLCQMFEDLYLRPFSTSSAVASGWLRLQANLEQRRAKAQQYSERFAGGPWRFLDQWRDSGVCWRYSILADEKSAVPFLSETLRNAGFHVSNLFWPLHLLFRPGDECSAAIDFAQRIMNFWVDDAVDEEYVRRCSDTLLQIAGMARTREAPYG